MSVKTYIKKAMGSIRCVLKCVRYAKGVYIGRNVHIVNGNRLIIGSDVQIRPDVDLFITDLMKIGDRSDVGARNRITGNVIIESDVLLGPDNYISSSDHIYDNPQLPIMDQGQKFISKNGHSELKICKGSWIGTHCAIIGDVHIGRNCVVGANSVVTKDIPDFCVVVGNPGKIIKKYNRETEKWEKWG
jgi:acetyltransferase-like isoleucine patch superfamily enzyme